MQPIHFSFWNLLILFFMAAIAGAAEKPNVLFIAIDDLNNELGCYGANYIKSPNIDRFARSGVLFDRAYCQIALCAPSRASVLSGARPASTKVHGLYDNFRDALADIQTLPELFKNHGYFADRIGKVFHLDDVQSWSKSHPAPKFGPGDPEKRAPYFNPAINEEGWRKFDIAKAGGRVGMELERSQRGPLTEIADCEDDELLDGQIAKGAVEKLGELKEKGQPFFLAVGFHKPHLPFVAPRKYWDLYDRASLPVARNVHPPENAPFAVGDNVEFMTYTDVPKERPIPEDYARLARHGYYACISFVDAQVGRVLDELDRLGLRDNTIVVLWSDHGFKLGEHGSWGKITNFEQDARVPLIVRAPGYRKNVRSSGMVELVDLYPTLAELAGLPLPAHLEGSSFVPLLEKPNRIWKHAVFTECPRGPGRTGYSIRTTLHRLNRWVKDGEPDSFELYYHTTDRRENVNLAGKPEYAAMQRDVLARLNAGWSSSASRAPNYDEFKVPPYTLPDPLVLNDGSPVRDVATWQQKRREELLELFAGHMHGRTPSGRPPEMHWAVTSEDRAALDGKAVRREVTISFTKQEDGPGLNVLIYQPSGPPPAGGWPLFLGLNNSGNLAVHSDRAISMSNAWMRDNKPARNITGNRATEATRGVQSSRWQIERVIARGYATVTAYCGDLCPDHSEGFAESAGAMFNSSRERQGDQWGAIGIWAWGLSRMMDFVIADPELDGARVALHGQSRLAKSALWAGAQDERFAMVIANCSTPGGAALSRRIFGETVAHLNFRFPHWYAENFRRYNDNESALPMDQHQLLALIAPRPLCLGTAEDDEWGDPRGEFLALKAAEPVYHLFGHKGLPASELPAVNRPVHGERLGFHMRSGKHDFTAFDWARYLDFADRIFKGELEVGETPGVPASAGPGTR